MDVEVFSDKHWDRLNLQISVVKDLSGLRVGKVCRPNDHPGQNVDAQESPSLTFWGLGYIIKLLTVLRTCHNEWCGRKFDTLIYIHDLLLNGSWDKSQFNNGTVTVSSTQELCPNFKRTI